MLVYQRVTGQFPYEWIAASRYATRGLLIFVGTFQDLSTALTKPAHATTNSSPMLIQLQTTQPISGFSGIAD